MSQIPPPPPSGNYSPNYQPPPKNDVVSTLIPYKNTQALISYYLGVFSLIPCIGLPLGIAAVILGIRGLQAAARNPEAKGKAHAIVGIICGSIFGLAYLVLGIIMIAALLMAPTRRL